MKTEGTMIHPDSDVSILVPRSQVSNAEYRGWQVADDGDSADDNVVDIRGSDNGES